jgi:serine phosphatase RsbU (regulator of sigma subunit)/anti-sigma regulatory factor (Ser/Thr protein kinase)
VEGRDEFAASAAYQPEPAAAAAARRFVRDTLRSWDVAALAADAARLVDDAVLLTSELVTNAVVHAGTPVDVICRLGGGEVEVVVRDRHPARMLPDPPAAADNPAERTSGRGLLLPTALASSWGVTYARTAKAVWFRISLADETGKADETAAAGGPAAENAGVPGLGGGAAWDMVGGLPAYGGAVLGGSVSRGAGVAVATALRGDIGALSYDELLRHTVETARDTVAADASYALVADEDGELRVRAAAGLGVADLLAVRSGSTAFANGAAAPSVVTVPFLVEGRVTGVLGVAAAEPARFGDDEAVALQQVADRVSLTLERARLGELERARRGRIAFLAEASELLAGTLDQEKIIALAAQLVVPRLATWCAILLTDEGEALRPAYVWHADESRIDTLAWLLETIAPPDVPGRSGGRSWSLAIPPGVPLPPGAAELASDAAWCFPLSARGHSLGVVAIGRPRGDKLPREAIELAEDLARRGALALDNARLYAQQQMTSQALQRSLLPPEVPRIPGLDLAAAHVVAGEGNDVGGDFYDVFPVGENRWRFAIGDVCGTGPEAAAVTGLARHTLRILAREGHGVAEVLGHLNRLILDEGPRARFITLLHGEIVVPEARGESTVPEARGEGAVPDAGKEGVRLSLVCAGHPLPLLLRHAGGPEPAQDPAPAAEPQPLLGVIPGLSFAAQSVDLFPGDMLLCVTDGVTERRESGRLLDDEDGLARLFAGCGGLNAGAVAARIQRVVRDFSTESPSDDMALLVLRVPALP